MFNFAIDQTCRSFSTALLSSTSLLTLSTHPGLPHLMCRTHHFPLLNFTWLRTAQSCNLSLRRASLPPRETIAPPSFVSPVNLLSIPSRPASNVRYSEDFLCAGKLYLCILYVSTHLYGSVFCQCAYLVY